MGHRSLSLPVRCERVACVDIFPGQVGEVLQDLLLGHPPRQVAKDIVDRDSHATDARLAASLARFHGDDVLISHRYDSIAL